MIDDPKKIDMNKLPKQLADGALGSFGKNIFAFAITSGDRLTPFATTPPVMKEIARWFNSQIEAHEKRFGTIEPISTEIISPLQMSDLGGNEDNLPTPN